MHKRPNKRVNRRKREKRFLMKLAPGAGIPFLLRVVSFLLFLFHYSPTALYALSLQHDVISGEDFRN